MLQYWELLPCLIGTDTKFSNFRSRYAENFVYFEDNLFVTGIAQ